MHLVTVYQPEILPHWLEAHVLSAMLSVRYLPHCHILLKNSVSFLQVCVSDEIPFYMIYGLC